MSGLTIQLQVTGNKPLNQKILTTLQHQVMILQATLQATLQIQIQLQHQIQIQLQHHIHLDIHLVILVLQLHFQHQQHQYTLILLSQQKLLRLVTRRLKMVLKPSTLLTRQLTRLSALQRLAVKLARTCLYRSRCQMVTN